MICTHSRKTTHFDENENRIRTREVCEPCGLQWSGVFAKRLDEEGREAWGVPFVWHYSDPAPLTLKETQ